jgi:hypothetical protein
VPTPRTDDTRLFTRALIGDVVVFGCAGSAGANVVVSVDDVTAAVAVDRVAVAAESSCRVVELTDSEVASAVFAGFTVRLVAREVAV